MESEKLSKRNYNTISPSARSLLFMKGYTDIPFARRAAELMLFPEKYEPDFERTEMTFWARLVHFENRYRTIDQFLDGLSIKNILEISSGFSFRGLETSKQKGIHYIDTDLPDVIASKNDFIDILKEENTEREGVLELLPLNALDEKQFRDIVNRFPEGEIAIVNEGLMMYLDMPEKEKLCQIIHSVLKERGGYWITADIYIRKQNENLGLKFDNTTKEFFEQHKIEDNKFESFEEAKAFFNRMGFSVDQEASVSRNDLSSMQYFLKNVSISELSKIHQTAKIQATWRLNVS